MPMLIPTLCKTPNGLADIFDEFGRKPGFAAIGPSAASGFLLAIILLFVLTAHAAEKVTPIREVLRDNDANYVPDRLGETFTVSGVLISNPVNSRGSGPDATERPSLLNLQDDSGGIVLFTRDSALLASGFRIGDTVQARG